MRDYLARLLAADEVLVTDKAVDPKHQLAAITQRVQKTSNKVFLFNNVLGANCPVVTNCLAVAKESRTCWAFNRRSSAKSGRS